MSISTDFVILDGVPRAKVAKALVEQSRTDMGAALKGIESAFANAATDIRGARVADSTPLHVAQLLERLTLQCGEFYDAFTAAVTLFDAGAGLVDDDAEGQADGA